MDLVFSPVNHNLSRGIFDRSVNQQLLKHAFLFPWNEISISLT